MKELKKASLKLLLILFILFSLVSCSQSGNNSNEQNIADSIAKTQVQIVGDSVIIPEFEIVLKLSANAEKKLKTVKESIVVQAYFSGAPKDPSVVVNEMGILDIASPRIVLSNERVARFENIKIAKASYDLLSDKNFEVLINVFSSGSLPVNLLDSEILQSTIDSIKGKQHVLNVKLIEGE